MESTDVIMNQPGRVQALRRMVENVADGAAPLVDLYRPYVDGLHNLPRDGRFLLVGNHTQFGSEALLIPLLVRRAIGRRLRPLADRNFGRMGGLPGDLLAAVGAVVGAPETARELMAHDEPILVFPGGGREIAKCKGEEYTLRWQGRAGFARLAVEYSYPIVPVGLVGGDDVYRSMTTREGLWGRLSQGLNERLSGRSDMAMPLMRGIGPTLIPRPQRMYLRFGHPIDTATPDHAAEGEWSATVKDTTQQALEDILADLQEIRADDPYRELNPFGWRNATMPTDQR